ncbi:DUF2057 family protein [Vibrio palustris]|uniref:UPF0319 protein VPAL9027_02367 n=1 Tax=Vibrio palustris TaxID=1918946 RepID=A0A1R4B638_9VIBR|nr:DUF2057 family protein [Vibrio palustris]SJL84384.1 hypothetical protein VPAL9027_02367 [Vibrio palustris]
MKTLTTLPCLLALTFAASASANVTIKVPSSVDMLVVDNAKPKENGGLFEATKTIDLKDGQHQILFRYKPVFTEGSDRYTVESEPLLATFTATDSEVKFDFPEYRNRRNAEKKIDNMTWSLVDGDGKTIKTKQDKLIKEGLQIGRNYPEEVAAYNKKGGVAAIGVPVNQASAQSHQSMPNNVQPGDDTAEQMLHFWYSKATPAAKARFKKFVNQ